MHPSEIPPVGTGHHTADAPSLGSQHRPRSNSGSSTSSGEDYCNSPSSRLPPWTPQVFSAERSPLVEQPPSLELAGSRGTFSGKLGREDSVRTPGPRPTADLARASIKPDALSQAESRVLAPGSVAPCCETWGKSPPLSGPSFPQSWSSQELDSCEPSGLPSSGSSHAGSLQAESDQFWVSPAGPSADDSSSTSSGEWYQNFQPPPQPPSTEQFECPGASGKGGGPGRGRMDRK